MAEMILPTLVAQAVGAADIRLLDELSGLDVSSIHAREVPSAQMAGAAPARV